MLLRGRTSPVAPFSGQDVKSYGKEKYSRNANAYALAVIHILYSFNIHYFNSKELWYTLKKLEYTRIELIIV